MCPNTDNADTVRSLARLVYKLITRRKYYCDSPWAESVVKIAIQIFLSCLADIMCLVLSACVGPRYIIDVAFWGQHQP